jgi:hypothetical protein
MAFSMSAPVSDPCRASAGVLRQQRAARGPVPLKPPCGFYEDRSEIAPTAAPPLQALDLRGFSRTAAS